MISIIIASANSDLLKSVSLNISETVGVEHEIVSVDNAAGKMGLCKIYNQGARDAKFSHLCFMHEDILIETKNWGLEILKIFAENQNLGVLGVVGCRYKSLAPSGWGAEYEIEDIVSINYIQSYKYANKPREAVYYNPTNKKLEEVATVDGMWFCTKKEIVEERQFDETTFTGFHGYDLDFCINVGRKYKIAVTYNVLMEHFSDGNFSKEWLEDSLKLHYKWIDLLPINKMKNDDIFPLDIEKNTFKKLILKLIKLDYDVHFIKAILNTYYKKSRISTKFYLKLYFFLNKHYYFPKKHLIK